MGRITTIPPSVSFADTLARGLMKRTEHHPHSLSAYRILLPTRRACRIMREAFLRVGEGRLMLLPRLDAIGDPDEDELSLLGAGSLIDAGDLAPAIHPVTALALLSGLIRKRENYTGNYSQSLALAQSLLRFLEELYLENKKLEDLKNLVPQQDLARHWQITLDFLDILKTDWHDVLTERGVLQAADRRNRLIIAQADLWRKAPPKEHIIAAGITGSVSATAALFKAIQMMPQSEIILPGLDFHLDDAAWEDLEPGHPQYSLKNLLQHLGIARNAVTYWEGFEPDNKDREKFLSEIMRPASHSGKWGQAELKAQAIEGLSLIDCENAHEESSVISVILREALEDPARKKRAVLVTPDRNLAARVQQKLKRWGIDIDDSAGRSLPRTQQGRFLLGLITAAQENWAPIALLSLLKQSLCGNALVPDLRKHILKLDLDFRGIKPLAPLERLKDITPLLPLYDLLTQFETSGEKPLKDWVITHVQICEQLAAADNKSGADRLWSGEAGEAMADLFSQLLAHSHHFGKMDLESYTALLLQMMRGVTVRPKYGIHPRLAILGLMEARLYHADLVILAGLNEGTWPPEVPADPWMSRPMRRDFGLPSPEQKIGFAAHDFANLFCAQHVLMTRSKVTEGTPQIAARWLLRMQAVLSAYDLALEDKSYYKIWAQRLDISSEPPAPVARPAPKPPKEKRLTALSVTGVEQWMRDPYAIYARKILKLNKLDSLEQENDAALRGDLIHKTLERFTRSHAMTSLPDNAPQKMQDIFVQICTEKNIDQPHMLPWYPRFLNICNWLDTHEKKWRASGSKPVRLESKGTYDLPLEDGQRFQIYGTADRIDQTASGALAIIDYKTGIVDKPGEAKEGFKPQLPLEGLIATKGDFEGLKAANIEELAFWEITGAAKSCGTIKTLDNPHELIAGAATGLRHLVQTFYNDDVPFYSLPNSGKAIKEEYQDYAHLARVKEWANEGEDAGYDS